MFDVNLKGEMMELVKVNEVARPELGIVVTIHRDSEHKIYLVRLSGRPESDFLTSDKSAAYSAMNKMFARALWRYWREHD